MTENFLSVRSVTKRYAGHTALDNVSLEVPRGKVFGLLGPNGAGKTTLIRILNRITAPDTGQVIFDGHPLRSADLAAIGYLPEERGLYKKMKVGEQAVYLARLKGLSRQEAVSRLKVWFEKLEITSWWDKKLEELSKGMAQKVQFVITVLHEPELLIFDEPFSGFDPVNAELLKREILELRDQGRTIIFSTHNMASVEDICDEIALIDRSRVALSGRVSDIKQRFRTGRFEVCGQGRLAAVPGLFDIVGQTEAGGLQRYLLAKAPSTSNSALASAVARSMELQLFSEQLPTMHEIFLKTVAQ
ncbi:MAG: ATP-binding cassette domain-containing protein [Prevotellaceae bacterium]|nr:ATP-binding cassette domain-containing protein [Prevotellaceae bacterium]